MPISDYVRGLRARVGRELLLLPAVAAIVRDASGRVLLQRRAENGRWDLPAGGVDPGEEPARAVVREVWEETGLRVVPVRLAAALGGESCGGTYPNGDRVEYAVSVFECRAVGGRLCARDGESSELRYFAPGDIPPLHTEYPRRLFEPHADDARAFFVWDDAWLEEVCR